MWHALHYHMPHTLPFCAPAYVLSLPVSACCHYTPFFSLYCVCISYLFYSSFSTGRKEGRKKRRKERKGVMVTCITIIVLYLPLPATCLPSTTRFYGSWLLPTIVRKGRRKEALKPFDMYAGRCVVTFLCLTGPRDGIPFPSLCCLPSLGGREEEEGKVGVMCGGGLAGHARPTTYCWDGG